MEKLFPWTTYCLFCHVYKCWLEKMLVVSSGHSHAFYAAFVPLGYIWVILPLMGHSQPYPYTHNTVDNMSTLLLII